MTTQPTKLNYFLMGALALTLAGSAYGYVNASSGNDTCTCGQEREPAMSEEERATHEAERITEISEVTGLSEDIIKTAFEEGKNMRDILSENGLDSETIHTALRAKAEERMKEHVSELVANGTLTQEEADERLAHMSERDPQGHGEGEGHGPRNGNGRQRDTDTSDNS
ncbi:MAG: hypothetical protein HGB03_00855 [Candidatus Yonathbacteria bacterium]|nr:hypothetical protein [Candidatus Yonathbacteria bacterium]NTW47812.1 hypothetical protein [Candidatus Yonathbacteria bacterium]